MMRRILLASVVGLAFITTAALGAGGQQYDPGGKARVSTYCTTTTNGDTPCPPGGGGGGGGNVTIVGPLGQDNNAGSVPTTLSTDQTQTHSAVQGVTVYIADPSTGSAITYSAPTNTNTAQVNGVTVLTGTGAVGTGAQRIAVGIDTATIAGSAPGTAGTASANVLTIQGIASMTPVQVSGASAAGDTTTSLKFVPVGAAAATNCSAQALTNAQINLHYEDLLGNMCVKSSPQVNNTVSGDASQTTGGTSTSLISAVTSKSIYVMSFECSNTGGSTSLITFQDGNGGTTLGHTIAPTGGGSNGNGGGVPLFHTTSGNALYFNPATSSTTVYCTASGFSQ